MLKTTRQHNRAPFHILYTNDLGCINVLETPLILGEATVSSLIFFFFFKDALYTWSRALILITSASYNPRLPGSLIIVDALGCSQSQTGNCISK
jgi:hypothetical protein